MDTPRFVTSPRAAVLAAVLVVLSGPALARAGREEADASTRVRCAPPVRNEAKRAQERRERAPDRSPACDDRPEACTLPPSLMLHCLRLLYALNSVCALSGEMIAVLNKPPPLVVQPPKPKPTSPGTPKTTPPPGPGGNPTPASAPEPGTLVTGVIGSALGIAAWLRRRRLAGARKSAQLPA